MKRLVCVILIIAMGFSFCIGESIAAEAETMPEEGSVTGELEWKELEALGKIIEEKGEFYTLITVPKDFMVGITQEAIDTQSGENYVSGKLNDDGSVTFKFNKQQYCANIKSTNASLEESIQKMVDDPSNAFIRITHNADYSVFEVQLNTEDVDFFEGFMSISFYMDAGFYSIFSGLSPNNVTIEYYGPNGEFLGSDSSKQEEAS